MGQIVEPIYGYVYTKTSIKINIDAIMQSVPEIKYIHKTSLIIFIYNLFEIFSDYIYILTITNDIYQV
jgi:hypothetical protein